MSVLYASDGYYIEQTTFEVDGKEYAQDQIEEVLLHGRLFPTPLELILNSILFVAGVAGVASFETIWLIPGLLAGAVGIFNIFELLKKFRDPRFLVRINMRNSESIRLLFHNLQHAEQFCRILNQQLHKQAIPLHFPRYLVLESR